MSPPPVSDTTEVGTAEAVPAPARQDSPSRPLSRDSPPSSTLVSSRPTSPSSIRRRSLSNRRPSSSTSSRRASLLSPPDPLLPQRLPHPITPADAAALTELHQELEAEQEAQVNRLLNMIRLQNVQSTGIADTDAISNAATIDSNSTRAGRINHRASNRMSRDSSFYRPRSVSRTSSPGIGLGNDSASESSAWVGPMSYDINFYVAESQMLKRENEMLKRRIRELEKVVADLRTDKNTGSESTPTEPLVPVPAESDVASPTSATAT